MKRALSALVLVAASAFAQTAPPPDALFTYYLQNGVWLWRRVDLDPALYLDRNGPVYKSTDGPVAVLKVRLVKGDKGDKGDPGVIVSAGIPLEEGLLYLEKLPDGTHTFRTIRIANATPMILDGVLTLVLHWGPVASTTPQPAIALK